MGSGPSTQRDPGAGDDGDDPAEVEIPADLLAAALKAYEDTQGRHRMAHLRAMPLIKRAVREHPPLGKALYMQEKNRKPGGRGR